MNKKLKHVSISTGICLLFGAIGWVATGDALENWFLVIKQPWYALPLGGWFAIAGLYYIICIIILYRLFSQPGKQGKNLSIGLTVGMIASNELWGYAFFAFESTFIGFFGLLPYVALVVLLFFNLNKYDRISARILFPYLLWLIYDVFWTYDLWILNK